MRKIHRLRLERDAADTRVARDRDRGEADVGAYIYVCAWIRPEEVKYFLRPRRHAAMCGVSKNPETVPWTACHNAEVTVCADLNDVQLAAHTSEIDPDIVVLIEIPVQYGVSDTPRCVGHEPSNGTSREALEELHALPLPTFQYRSK